MTILAGGTTSEIFNIREGDGVVVVDGGSGVDTLNADWSGSTDDVFVSVDSANPGWITDPAIGSTVAIRNIEKLSFTGGAGDDQLTVTGSAEVAIFNGGGGSNLFSGDFSDTRTGLNFALNTKPGFSSTVIGQGSVLTNVQTISIHSGSASDSLTGGGGDDSLYGGAGSDFLTGGAGNDLLDGGTGADVLKGGTGDDVYVVGDVAETVIESPGEGLDTVQSTVDFTLPSNVENLLLLGPGDFGGGNALANVLTGGAGGQTLDGMGGADTLTGGSGPDIFVMRQGYGQDVITDFETGVDRVRLDAAGMTNFAQVTAAMTQTGADVVLNLGAGDQLLFQNHKVSDFSAEDFMLPLDTSRLTPTFADEFDSLSLFKTGHGGTWWTVYGSGGGPVLNHTLTSNNERQLYVDPTYAGTGPLPLGLNPFSINNGVLDITATNAPSWAQPFLSGYQYVSGLLNTKTTFAQQYGYFEVRAKLPSGQGLWPAFWLLPSNFQGTPELDIFEQKGGDPSTIYQSAHSKLATSPPYSPALVHLENPDQFHTFGLKWDQNYLVWYIDGVETSRQLTAPNMNTPMYILLDLAVGGFFPGDPDATTVLPASMSIDYVHVYKLNDNAPTAVGDSYKVTQDTVLSVPVATGLTANDTDPDASDANWLGAVLVAGPAHGTVTIGTGGAFSYKPNAHYIGSDSFTYMASDGLSQSAPATVNLTVNPFTMPNIAPTATIAQAALAAVEQATIDLKSAGLSIADPDAGTGSLTVTLSVGEGVLTVLAGSSGAAVANSGTGSVTVTGTVAQINALLGSDPASTVSYVDPNDAPAASTTLTLLVHDNGNTGSGGDLSSSANGTITIVAVNDLPIATADSVAGAYNTPLVLDQAAFLANDSDPDGDALNIAAVTGASHGTVGLSGGQITFTPTTGYFGPAGFSYIVSDGHGGSATASVAVQVPAPNPPQITGSAPSASLVEAGTGVAGLSTSSVSLAISGGIIAPTYVLTGWKASGAGLYSQSGTYGSAMLDTVHNTLTYTLSNTNPATNALSAGQAVSDAFSVAVSDGRVTATDAVSFAITGTNDAPSAKSDGALGVYNTPLVLQSSALLANDIDPDGGPLTITAVGAAQHGTVALSPTGQVTFTPFFGFVGFARFSYTISDGHGGSSTAFVGVTVKSTTNNNIGPTYVFVGAATTGQTVDVSGDGQPHSVIGSAFNDLFYGATGNDTLNGGTGNDTINGGAGDDLISGGPGGDTLYGGLGADRFIWTLADVTGNSKPTQDGVLDFEGAGDGRASGDFLIFQGFSPGSTLTLFSQSGVNPHLYYYTLTDHASGASELIALNSVDGLQLARGDFLFL